jgi:hypothetical protein
MSFAARAAALVVRGLPRWWCAGCRAGGARAAALAVPE